MKEGIEVYLLLGSNLGDRFLHLEKARQFIEKEIGKIIRKSSIYETQAWGEENQPDFLNQVMLVKTTLCPENLLNTIQVIEKKIGRYRHDKWGARIIDIDILFYGQEVIKNKNLQVPHPYLPFRRFALKPLSEICNGLVHPELGADIHTLLERCPDQKAVSIVKEVLN